MTMRYRRVATSTMNDMPREVQAHESTATEAELKEMLGSRELAPEDLVNDGAGWQTFAEHPLFGDAAAPALASRSRKKWLLVAGVVVAYFGYQLLTMWRLSRGG